MSPQDTSSRLRLANRLLAGAAFTVVIVAGFFGPGAGSAFAQEETPGTTCPAQDGGALASPVDPPLKLQVSQLQPFRFGRSTEVDLFRIPFRVEGDIPEPDIPLLVTISDFRRVEGGRLAFDRVSVASEVSVSTGFLVLCIDPTGGDWGRFEGTITIDDPRFEVTSIPVSVELQYSLYPLVIATVLFVIVAAVIFKWAETQQTSASPLTPSSIWPWIMARPIAAASSVVAAVGVFMAQYWTQGAWDGDPQRFVLLIAAVFTVVVAALSAGELLKPTPTTDKKLKVVEEARDDAQPE